MSSSSTPMAFSMPSGGGDAIWRTLSKTFSHNTADNTADNDSNFGSEEQDKPISKAEDWKLMPAVKDAKANDAPAGRQLGVTWKGLTIKGVNSDTSLHENVLTQFNIPQLVREARQPKQLKTIVDSSFGCVKPGEMLLVLGRPGAGCTSLLKVLSNRRKGYVLMAPFIQARDRRLKSLQLC